MENKKHTLNETWVIQTYTGSDFYNIFTDKDAAIEEMNTTLAELSEEDFINYYNSMTCGYRIITLEEAIDNRLEETYLNAAHQDESY